MKPQEFYRWFNKDFWEAFKNKTIPVTVPQTEKDKAALLERVYKSIISARYAPPVSPTTAILFGDLEDTGPKPTWLIDDEQVKMLNNLMVQQAHKMSFVRHENDFAQKMQSP